jgi:tetratricopeptide (TPR) repeat protein
MLGATSLLSGGYTPIASRARRQRRHRRTLRKSEPPCVVGASVISRTTASAMAETRKSSVDWTKELESSAGGDQVVATTKDDCDYTFSSSGGSSCDPSDSFVVAIDWDTTTSSSANGPAYYHPIVSHDALHRDLNDSMEDPSLAPLESVRHRLFPIHHLHLPTSPNAKPNTDQHPLNIPSSIAPPRPLSRASAAVLYPTSTTTAIRSVYQLLGGSLSMSSKKLGPLNGSSLPQPPPPPGMEATSVSTATTSCAKSLGSFAMPPLVPSSLPLPSCTHEMRDRGRGRSSANLEAQKTTATVAAASAAAAAALEDEEGFWSAVERDDDDDDIGSFATTTIFVPRQPQFAPPNVSTSDNDLVSDDDDNDEDGHSTDASSSFVIPTMPVLTKPPTPWRKQQFLTRQRIDQLKAELEQLKRQSARSNSSNGRCSRNNNSSASSMPMAKLYLALAALEQQLHDYPAAINFYFHAAALFRHAQRPVALATALDAAAVAYGRARQQGLDTMIHRQHGVGRFFQCLYEALELRKRELGAWHVDTVDTLQHLAQLCLVTGQAEQAARYYLEVVQLRKVIFGPRHAGTAVTAHGLANAYFQSHDLAAAEIWYEYALGVYHDMGLTLDKNPAVKKLVRDWKRLERVDRWITEEDPADDENLLFEL